MTGTARAKPPPRLADVPSDGFEQPTDSKAATAIANADHLRIMNNSSFGGGTVYGFEMSQAVKKRRFAPFVTTCYIPSGVDSDQFLVALEDRFRPVLTGFLLVQSGISTRLKRIV